MSMALEGIRILDLSRYPPGPFCTMMLGDMGADVIHIEPPESAGGARATYGTSRNEAEAERAAAFDPLRRNKRHIFLNLRDPEARDVFYKLTESADVVLEGFRPGVVRRLGVDYDTLKEINTRLIYCSLTGYGQEGVYKNLPGHDINYISMAGALGMIGVKEGPPVIPYNLLADYAAGGLHAVIGILLAVIARDRTGRGQYVDIAMMDGVISMLAPILAGYFSGGVVPGRGEMLLNGAGPQYNVYETSDGKYISIGSLEPWFWENLCKILGREEFTPYAQSQEKWPEISTIFKEVFRTKTREEWFRLLTEVDICVGRVYSLDEAVEDPQWEHRRMVIEVEHPVEGRLKQVGIAIKLSETPGKVRFPAPNRGQDTEAVLLEVGYPKEHIHELRDRGAVA